MGMDGQTISHYRILEKMGRGGMGEVYKAEDTRLKRIVALKFISPELTLDEDAKTRFAHEAQAASALQHHNICTIHEIDQTADGRMFICMDYYAGDTLKAKNRRGPLPLGEAVDIAAQAAEGLAKAHDVGMVHRDVKPANIVVTGDGVVKILDFGIAMLSDRTRVTKMGTTVGTVAYMSPEQAQGGEITPRADVWSLGVILYEMLTGKLPFEAAHEAAIFYAITNEPHKPVTGLRDDIPPELVRIVDRALAKEPGERYRDAGEMARELRDVLKTMEDRERTAVSTDMEAGRGASRTKIRVWLPVAVVALITVGVLIIKPLLFDGELVSAPRPIAVISFENRTGDTEYDYLREVIPNLLITSLEQSKYLSVVTWERMHDLLKQVGRGDVELIDKETGFEVCRMDSVDIIVVGSFTKAGDVFATDVKVLDVHSKELLKSASARGEGVESILESQIDELGKEISRGVGLSERLIAAAGSLPIAAVTTSSMDAYDYFLRGRQAYEKLYYADAQHDLEKAVELDSTFAVAWLYLARAYGSSAQINARKDAYEKAKSLSAGAPEKDRLYIEAFYANTIEGDDSEYHRLLAEITAKYPREKEAFVWLGVYYRNKKMFRESENAYLRAIELDPNHGKAYNGIAYMYAEMQDYDRAIEYFGRYAATSPGDANPFDSMGEVYVFMGRLDEAITMYERALAIKPDFGSGRGIAYIRALREDYAGAIEMIDQYMASNPSRRVLGWLLRAYYCAHGCRWQDAIELVEARVQAAEQIGYRFGVASARWVEAWIRYLMGDYGASRGCLDESESIMESINRRSSWGEVIGGVALGLIDLKLGLVEDARSRLDTIDTALPRVVAEDPLLADFAECVAALYRAEVLLAEGSIDRCIEVSRSATPPSVPPVSDMRMFFYNYPANRDVLARAYVEKGALDDAIAEYEHLITFDSESRDFRLIFPLFHYRLGVLYEKTGQTEKAERQYEKLLEICGDVSPEIAEVADARRRLAALPQPTE